MFSSIPQKSPPLKHTRVNSTAFADSIHFVFRKIPYLYKNIHTGIIDWLWDKNPPKPCELILPTSKLTWGYDGWEESLSAPKSSLRKQQTICDPSGGFPRKWHNYEKWVQKFDTDDIWVVLPVGCKFASSI